MIECNLECTREADDTASLINCFPMKKTLLVVLLCAHSVLAFLGSSNQREFCIPKQDVTAGCDLTLFWWTNSTELSWQEANNACQREDSQLPAAWHVKYFLKRLMDKEARSFFLSQPVESTSDEPRSALGEKLCIAIRTRSLASPESALLEIVNSSVKNSCSSPVSHLVCQRTISVHVNTTPSNEASHLPTTSSVYRQTYVIPKKKEVCMEYMWFLITVSTTGATIFILLVSTIIFGIRAALFSARLRRYHPSKALADYACQKTLITKQDVQDYSF